jgi:ATP-dependent DNA helicase RecQ
MSENIHALLKSVFGFDEFRAGQREVVEELLGAGKSLAVFPTGGGKSLCYQLPALALDGTTIVVSPLIALMKDQIDFLQSRGVRAERLDSSLDWNQTRDVQDALRRGELKLLYVAPERFNNERFLETLRSTNIALFAIDEAHCISEWGHNFRPDYLKLAELTRELNIQRILALTATATPEVAASICEGFSIPPNASINTGFYRPNLNLCLTPIESNKREAFLLNRLQKRAPGATIIYVTLQKTAENLAEFLSENGVEARPYHAGMQNEDRGETQDWWMQGDGKVVVATIAFGMGIDKSDVRYVYHFNLPKGLESYSQEIGRAGRDDLPSTVELLACPDDVPTLENFVYGDTPTEDALFGLVEELLNAGEEFAVSEYDLSARHDLRPLVLKTTLTYLELDGVLRQGTPFYAGYEVQPNENLEAMFGAFGDKAQTFLRELFGVSKQGRVWWKIDPDVAAEQLKCDRRHIVRAMAMLEEKGVAVVKAADARKKFHRLRAEEDGDEIVDSLMARFARREENEIKRIADILKLVEFNGCQTNALVAHFGEIREAPCGHCTFCKTGKLGVLPASRPLPEIETLVSPNEISALQREYSEALGEPRQVARFLCGLSSPAASKAKLMRLPLSGKLENHRFAEVLEWCEQV